MSVQFKQFSFPPSHCKKIKLKTIFSLKNQNLNSNTPLDNIFELNVKQILWFCWIHAKNKVILNVYEFFSC